MSTGSIPLSRSSLMKSSYYLTYSFHGVRRCEGMNTHKLQSFFAGRTIPNSKRIDAGPCHGETHGVDAHGLGSLNVTLILVVVVDRHVRGQIVAEKRVVMACPVPVAAKILLAKIYSEPEGSKENVTLDPFHLP